MDLWIFDRSFDWFFDVNAPKNILVLFSQLFLFNSVWAQNLEQMNVIYYFHFPKLKNMVRWSVRINWLTIDFYLKTVGFKLL